MSAPSSRPYAHLGYGIAAILVLLPMLDLAANVWPWNPGNTGWRYGSYGIMAGFLLSPLTGLALGLATSSVFRHRRVRKVLAAVAGLAGLVVVTASVLYVLDALQIRASVPTEARQQFGIGTVKALAKNLIAALTLIWFAWIGWRRRGAAVNRRSA